MNRGTEMRNNRAVICCLVIVFFLASAVVSGMADETICFPTGTVTLAPPDAVDQQRAEVDFPHAVHFDYTCKTCHHKWEGEEQIQSCMTSGCHDLAELPEAEEGKPPAAELRTQYYKNAYHGLCIGCHKDIKSRNQALEKTYSTLKTPLQNSGPTGCIECHPRY